MKDYDQCFDALFLALQDRFFDLTLLAVDPRFDDVQRRRAVRDSCCRKPAA